jgi:phage shock protein A
MSSHSDVEAELARLKGGSEPPAIEGGSDDGAILEAEPEARSQTQAGSDTTDKP